MAVPLLEDEGIDPAVEAEFSTPPAHPDWLELTEDGQLLSPFEPTYAQPSGDPYEESMERWRGVEEW